MAGRKPKNQGQIKGQTPNPNEQPHMRRLQGVLNAKYAREASAVEALDWARHQIDPETKALFTDRDILAEALIALGEKAIKGYRLPTRTDGVVIPEAALNTLTQRLGEYIEGLVSTMSTGVQITPEAWERRRASFHEDVHMAVNEAISTNNLAGESYKYEGDDDD
jgi:hypothetical protein